jgi:glycine cleavage system H protein
MADIPADLKYTKDHEWARTESATRVRVGVSRHAVEALGDITLVNFDVKAGDALAVGKAFGTVESVKAVSDLFAPLSGTVVEVHAALLDQPEKVNEDPYGAGWMVLVEPLPRSNDLDALMDAEAYERFLGTL